MSFITSLGLDPKDKWRVWSLMKGNFKLKLSTVMEKLFQMVTSHCSEGDSQPMTHMLPSCRILGKDSERLHSQHYSITVTSYLLGSYKCFCFSRYPIDQVLPLRCIYRMTFTWEKMQKEMNIQRKEWSNECGLWKPSLESSLCWHSPLPDNLTSVSKMNRMLSIT